MDPVGSWSAYAATYTNHRVDSGQTASPFTSTGFLSPPPTYDHSVFAPLFHQKAAGHFAPLRPPPTKPSNEDLYPQVGSGYEQPNVWSQSQLASPFGILPHESVIPNSFNFQQPVAPQYPDLKRIPPSPPKPPATSSTFFQPNFLDSSYQKFDYNPKPYQPPCANKDYRRPQPQVFVERERNFLEKDKTYDECQSSPISYALMDNQRSYERPKSPQYVINRFGYSAMLVTDNDFQRSKSSESFSSSSSSTGVECSRSDVNSFSYTNCYKENQLDSSRLTSVYPPPPPPPLPAPVPTAPPSATIRLDRGFVDVRNEWDDRGRRGGYSQDVLPDINRGDPMSLVKNLQQDREPTLTEKIPPPAHPSERRQTVYQPVLPLSPQIPIQRPTRLTLEEELAEFSSPLSPREPFYKPNPNRRFLSAYMRFLRGKKDERPEKDAPIRIVRSRMSILLPKQYPNDPRDDPRYYPLPLDSDDRSFSSSDDSSDEWFGFYYYGKSNKVKVSNSPKYSKEKNCSSGNNKKKKGNLAERSTQTKESPIHTNEKNGSKVMKHRKTKSIKLPTSKKNEGSGMSEFVSTASRKMVLCSKSTSPNKNGPSGNRSKLKSVIEEKNEDVNCLRNNRPMKEVHFVVNDYLVKKDYDNNLYPILVRVKEGGIVQRFQHFIKDGVLLYNSLPTVLPLSGSTKDEYTPLEAEVSCPSKTFGLSVIYIDRVPLFNNLSDRILFNEYMKSTSYLQDSFEVYIQTLFSQSLDSNFLQEIYDEKDEYFISNVRRIEEVESKLINSGKERLSSWSESDLSALTVYPSYRLSRAIGRESKCSCGRSAQVSSLINSSSGRDEIAANVSILRLHGWPYSHKTLLRDQTNSNSTSPLLTKELLCCDQCLPIVESMHSICHNKLALFAKCDERVAQFSHPDKDTTAILNSLLAGDQWLNQVFMDVRMLWFKVDKLLKR